MKIVAFGIGINFFSYIERLDTVMKLDFFSDNNEKKWDQYLMGDDRICIAPDTIKKIEDPFVIITAEKETSICAIENQLDNMNIPHVRVGNILENELLKPVSIEWLQKIQNKRIHKFIELLVHGTTECNFHCDYCYVWRKEDFHNGMEASLFSPQEIRRALSLKRLGGVCHINMCALGETLLAKDIDKIIYELAAEGHYISIITNGTVSTKINKILEFSQSIQQKIFFKFSYHFLELERIKQFDRFWQNVKAVKESQCSYSIEITPSDLLINRIDEIKEDFNRHENGRMPHVTFTRDATKEGLDLYSQLSLDNYIKTWSVFNSDLFETKVGLYKRKIEENCYAGCWSYRINLMNGNLQSCYKQEIGESIFQNTNKNIPLNTVKSHCRLDYCFNNHAFIVWGDVPQIECKNYLQMRDRCDEKEMWVKEPYRAVMKQKLYDNNFQYIDRWEDYEKLYDERKPAFILFNSPDYGNLGDHAIAYAEKCFFNAAFPDIDFIEISPEQYIKENQSIINAILPEDILLISGGGYIGSLWTWLEDITLNIIKTFPNNKIIIMPQTVFFENTVYGEYEKQLFFNILEKHKNITLFLRDKKSVEMIQKSAVISTQLVKSCDMALFLNLDKYNNIKQEDKALICMREDKERNVKINVEAALNKKFSCVSKLSTVVDRDVYLDNRNEELDKIWTEIASSQLIVTDRLHAAIFSYLLGIPCIVFDNKNGKVFEFARTVEKHSSICKCKSAEELEQLIKEKKYVAKRRESDKFFSKEFEEMKRYLKERCFT